MGRATGQKGDVEKRAGENWPPIGVKWPRAGKSDGRIQNLPLPPLLLTYLRGGGALPDGPPVEAEVEDHVPARPVVLAAQPAHGGRVAGALRVEDEQGGQPAVGPRGRAAGAGAGRQQGVQPHALRDVLHLI